MAERPAFDEAKRGSAELLILALVEDDDLHGYEIGRQIELRSGGTLTLHAGRALRHALSAGGAALDQRPLGREGRPAAPPALPDHRGRPEGARLAARRLGPVRRGARPGGRRPLRLSGGGHGHAAPRSRLDVGRRAPRAHRPASTLSSQTIDELATHLEDIYLAARADGDGDEAAAPEGRSARSKRPASCRSAVNRDRMPARPTRASPTTPPRRPDPGVSPWATPSAWRCGSSACSRPSPRSSSSCSASARAPRPPSTPSSTRWCCVRCRTARPIAW